MRRAILATIFILHGLAHSAAGIWATSLGPSWVVVPLWLLAEAGFIGAGLGLAGVAGLRTVWQQLAFIAGISSVALLAAFGTLPLLVGLGVDAVLFVLATALVEGSPLVSAAPDARRSWRFVTGSVLALAAFGYLSSAILLRPWHTNWGTTRAERMSRLPGDALVPDAHYRIDHAVTVRAPADSVWPWLVQIGQDRAGFYSYDRLEQLIGDDVHNADRIHPEWQDRKVGDLVRATQPDYLGGRFGSSLGWHVVEVAAGRAVVLEQWGAFVIVPVDDRTSRVHVRTRGEGKPSLLGVLAGPVSLLVLEPAHFIMERRMLLGIRDRAESSVGGMQDTRRGKQS
jgi:hypothetical protein